MNCAVAPLVASAAVIIPRRPSPAIAAMRPASPATPIPTLPPVFQSHNQSLPGVPQIHNPIPTLQQSLSYTISGQSPLRHSSTSPNLLLETQSKRAPKRRRQLSASVDNRPAMRARSAPPSPSLSTCRHESHASMPPPPPIPLRLLVPRVSADEISPVAINSPAINSPSTLDSSSPTTLESSSQRAQDSIPSSSQTTSSQITSSKTPSTQEASGMQHGRAGRSPSPTTPREIPCEDPNCLECICADLTDRLVVAQTRGQEAAACAREQARRITALEAEAEYYRTQFTRTHDRLESVGKVLQQERQVHVIQRAADRGTIAALENRLETAEQRIRALESAAGERMQADTDRSVYLTPSSRPPSRHRTSGSPSRDHVGSWADRLNVDDPYGPDPRLPNYQTLSPLSPHSPPPTNQLPSPGSPVTRVLPIVIAHTPELGATPVPPSATPITPPPFTDAV